MPTNVVSKDSDVITIPAPLGGVTAGELVIVGGIVGVAQTTADADVPVALWRGKVCTLTKTGSETWALGARARYDMATKKLLAAGKDYIGTIVVAAAAGDTTAGVLLYERRNLLHTPGARVAAGAITVVGAITQT